MTSEEAARSVEDLDLPVLDLSGATGPEERRERIERVRAQHWVARTTLGYAIVSYDDCLEILRDRRFRNGMHSMFRALGITDERYLARRPNPFLRSEGDEHHRLRRLVIPALTARRVNDLRPFMRRTLDRLLDGIATRGSADLVADVFDPFPISVICQLLGAPGEDWHQIDAWVRDIFLAYGPAGSNEALDQILRAHDELDAYVIDLIERRRRAAGDDLITTLIAAEEAGDRLSTQDLMHVTSAFLLAGTDTTRNQLGLTMATLLSHPDQLEDLRTNPDGAPLAVEECLRYLSTAQAQPRVAPVDVEHRGVVFPAGTLVMTHFVGANNDPQTWEAPHRFDAKRPPVASGHVTFGSGTHFCIGASLARAELDEGVRAVLDRLPEIELAAPLRFRPNDGFGMLSLERLDVTFAPQAVEDAARNR